MLCGVLGVGFKKIVIDKVLNNDSDKNKTSDIEQTEGDKALAKKVPELDYEHVYSAETFGGESIKDQWIFGTVGEDWLNEEDSFYLSGGDYSSFQVDISDTDLEESPVVGTPVLIRGTYNEDDFVLYAIYPI
jgi:hypothetical protein